MDRVLEMIAGTEWDGSSLEKMLLREFHFTRRQISRLKFLPGALQVNCERSRVSRILRAGDRVRVTLPKECRVEETPGQSNSLPQTDTRTLLAKKQAKSADLREESVKTARSADILWDDEDLLVVNKPAGIAVHPSHGHWEDTLLRILEERNAIPSQKETACPSAGQRTPKLYPVGRLDKDTSGLMVFAKHSVAAERLQRKGAVQKTYLAFVYGCFPPEQRVFTIDYPIRRKSGYLNRMEVVWEEIRTGEKIRRPIETRRAEKTESSAEVQAEQEKPLPAITHGEVIEQLPGMTIVRLHLETGRTHQIRVHLASIAHPLLGDSIYGADFPAGQDPIYGPDFPAGQAVSRGTFSKEIGRAALHCASMVVRHPITGDELSFESPLPEDMMRVRKRAAECKNAFGVLAASRSG